MKEILKFIGWTDLYPQTLERLEWFKSGFREYYDEKDLSEDRLDKAIVFGLGKYGQSMVYNIWAMTKNCMDAEDSSFLIFFEDFVDAFKVLDFKIYSAIKPDSFIDLFLEYMYSKVIKGEYPKSE